MKFVLSMVSVLLFIMVPITADNGSLEILSDVPSVPVYVDNTYAGITPLSVPGLSGSHLIKASPEGYFEQTQNISISPGEVKSITFTFLTSDEQMPAMVKIGECIGTPQPSNLDGMAYDLMRISDGTLMAYLSGRNEGIQCLASSDGITWNKIPESCLADSGKDAEFRSEPWVFRLPDGTYRMIFSQIMGNDHHLYTASSQDGIHFSNEEEITITGINGDKPESPSVPSGVVYPDGIVRIYYNVPGTGIKSAVSEDMGISWKAEDGVRIPYGTDPTSLLLPDGKTGMVFVDTTPKSKGQRIYFSISDDGLDFTKYPNTRILESIEPGVWLMDPEVVEEGDVVHLYFSVMGMEGMQHHGLPGILRSIIDLECLEDLSL